MHLLLGDGWDGRTVVPLAGDVDRNLLRPLGFRQSLYVVPLAGDVDRNISLTLYPTLPYASSPSRGTWIEILLPCGLCSLLMSSPSRGTWIEMP